MPSYSPVYSAQFVVRNSSDPLVPFVVPDGYTAVIRDFTVYTPAAGFVAAVTIQDSAEAETVTVALITGVDVPAYGQWQGRIALPAPGIVGVSVSDIGAAADIYVGGYLLRNVLT